MPKRMPDEATLEAFFKPAAEKALQDLGIDTEQNEQSRTFWNDAYRHAYAHIIGTALPASDNFDEYLNKVEDRTALETKIDFKALKKECAEYLNKNPVSKTDSSCKFNAGTVRQAVTQAGGEAILGYLKPYKAVFDAPEKQMQAWGADPVAHVNAWNHYVNGAASSPLITLQLESAPLPALKDTLNSLPHPSENAPSNEDIQARALQVHNTYETGVKAQAGQEDRFSEIDNYIQQSLKRIAFRAAIDELQNIQKERRIQAAVMKALSDQLERFGITQESNSDTWGHFISNTTMGIMSAYESEVYRNTKDIAAALSNELTPDTAINTSYITPEVGAAFANAFDETGFKNLENATLTGGLNPLQVHDDINSALDRIGYRAAINELKAIQKERSGGQSPQ